MYVIAWFVPVHAALGHLPDAIPGAEAVRAALIPIWPDEGISFEASRFLSALYIASAFTNVLALVLALAVWSGKRAEVTQAGWACLVAGLINAHWVLGLEGSVDASDLRAGYFLWWLSFVVAAAGALWLARQLPARTVEETVPRAVEGP